jgi:DNA-directed RNA polymerase II subunit RPB11
LENNEVQFAGYKKPHPLENKIEIKLRTSYQTKPVEALNRALNGLITKVTKISHDFEKELKEISIRKTLK